MHLFTVIRGVIQIYHAHIYIYISTNHMDDYVLKWTDSKKIPRDNLKLICP